MPHIELASAICADVVGTGVEVREWMGVVCTCVDGNVDRIEVCIIDVDVCVKGDKDTQF